MYHGSRIWASQLSESLQKTQSDGLESGLALSYQSSSNPGLWQATTLCLSPSTGDVFFPLLCVAKIHGSWVIKLERELAYHTPFHEMC